MADVNSAYDKQTISSASEYLRLRGSVQLLDFLSSSGLKKLKSKWSRNYNPLEFSLHHGRAPIIKGLPDILQLLTGLKKWKYALLCLEKGDYSVLYDELKPGKGFAFFLDLSDLDESWGGYTSFMKDSEEIIRVVPRANALTVVNQAGLKSFHKYVNHHASHSRVFLYGVLQK